MAFKPGTLAARWRKNFEGNGPDVVIYRPNRADGALLWSALAAPMYDDGGRSFIQELEQRGYDLSTLQFTIRKAREGEGVEG